MPLSSTDFSTSIQPFHDVLVTQLRSSSPDFTIINSFVLGHPHSYTRIQLDKTTLVDFTISYDNFYQVPVLHLRKLIDEDGTLKRVTIEADRLSMDVHPILNEVWYFIHPCDTAQVMDQFGVSGVDYLKVWFATYGVPSVFPDVQLR